LVQRGGDSQPTKRLGRRDLVMLLLAIQCTTVAGFKLPSVGFRLPRSQNLNRLLQNLVHKYLSQNHWRPRFHNFFVVTPVDAECIIDRLTLFWRR